MRNNMPRTLLMASFLGVGLSVGLVACDTHEGPAERAGEDIDRAMENAGDKTEQAGEEARDSIEQAGDKIEDATDK